MIVRVLPDVLVDRIAAGEVVERPASVVKELVENALDAGATRLEIRLKDGGVGQVRVIDDGSGMAREDALLCLERHATSKIRAFEDLDAVATMGFRGEALPSIASVSRLELRTRRPEDEVGTEVRVDGGRIEHVGPAAVPAGTDIAVRGLFAHLPARRKFLRARTTELAHATSAVVRALLVRPDVGVLVQHDGRDLLRAEATDDPARRIADLLGDDLRGLGHGLARADGVEAEAWVSAPGVDRATPAEAVWTFVGGRYVRDAVLRKAVAEGLAARASVGRHPVVVVRLRVPPGDVDHNVHPAKIEVRFRAPHAVSRAVREAVAAAAGTARPVESVREAQPALELPPRPASMPMPMPMHPPTPSPTPAMPSEDLLERWRPAPVEALPEVLPPPVRTGEPAPVAAEPALGAAPMTPEPTRPAPAGLRLGVRAGSLAVVVADDGAWVVDLAALRRAALLGALRAAHAAGGVEGRLLLAPVIVVLPASTREALLARADALQGWGVGLADVGPQEVALTALPDGVPADGALLHVLARTPDPAAALARAGARAPHDDAEAAAWLAEARAIPVDALCRLDEARMRGLLRGG